MILTSCGGQISDKYVIGDQPATLTEIPGTELKSVTLTEKAVERLGIQLAEVSAASETLTVPSGALWMDIEGTFWVYTNPEPNVYIRHAVEVLDDDGQLAVLSSGPDPGTLVVTAGVPELFGTEVGVGK
jgi:hypothetical protein